MEMIVMRGVGCVLLLTAVCWAKNFDANNFLEKFGYLDDLAPGQSGHSEDTTSEAVREFQRFNGLQVTGRLDPNTVRKMQQPRCGLPDVIKPSKRAASLRDNSNNNNRRGTGRRGRNRPEEEHPLAYYAPGYKWEKRDITYKLDPRLTTRQLSQQQQLAAFRNAFQKWADVVPLNFRQVTSGDADIDLTFERRQHSDGPGNAFDGRGGTLAHAYFPGTSPISGDTHFDDDEQWTMNTEEGTNLEIVAAHEFGHALGLGHSNVRGALMAPFYPGYDPNYGLHRDDVSGIQTLYGRGRGSAGGSSGGGSSGGTTPRPTTPAPKGPYCSVKFDAIAQGYDGYTYGFSGDKVFKISSRGVEQELTVTSLLPGAPSSPGAAVYDRYKRQFFIFKGRQYWRFSNGFTLDSGYPRSLPSDFGGARAAIQWSDHGIYLFLRNNMYVRWAEGLTRASSNSPARPVNSYFQGAPPNIEAALHGTDGYFYFFKGRRYWKYSARAQLQSGYPKDIRPAWLSCGGFQPR